MLLRFTLVSLLSIILIGVFLFVNIFGLPNGVSPGHDNDSRSVFIEDSEIDVIREKYDSDLEKGFCLYGDYSNDSIRVRDVVHDDNPVSQNKHSISFNCIDETVERLPKLVNDDSYRLIGNVHTHPRYAKLSRPDAFTFGSFSLFQEAFGIYNGDELEFFTSRSLSYGLEKHVKG